MKRLIPLFIAISISGLSEVTAAPADNMQSANPEQIVYKLGTFKPYKGSEKVFTGDVRVDPWYPAGNGMRNVGASVTFEPGARSHWHTHPVGQALIVTSGIGLTQEWGKPIQEVRPGDVIICPVGVKHWHGAAPNSSMTHISIAEDKDGSCVDWLEEVTDDQYYGRK